MKTIATILRSGWRPPVEQLHQQAFGRLGPEAYGDVVLTVPPAPVAVPGGFAPRPAYRPERPAVPAQPPRQEPVDPHTHITAAVQAGRHQEADAVALAHEQAAARAHGPASEQALHWSEVRADLAMFAKDSARSCGIWLTVAQTRLAAGQAPDSPDVEKAVDRAHHQWGQVRDKSRAQELGTLLAQLRVRVPGRRPGALENVRKQLRELQATPF
jgi:hypothetical protein